MVKWENERMRYGWNVGVGISDGVGGDVPSAAMYEMTGNRILNRMHVSLLGLNIIQSAETASKVNLP